MNTPRRSRDSSFRREAPSHTHPSRASVYPHHPPGQLRAKLGWYGAIWGAKLWYAKGRKWAQPILDRMGDNTPPEINMASRIYLGFPKNGVVNGVQPSAA